VELNHRISVTVNDEVHAIVVESRLSLLDFLREKLGLVGAHAGCEHGVCGTCTVIVDGKSVRSCLMLAVQANGTSIQTVEGLAIDGELSPLQEAFWNKQALQCGFCTPGMLLRATELLRANPDPSAAEIREALASNLCRCTGYAFIIEAVLEAAATTRERTA
tara:strand:- start:1358 stop:1843 length:486 start_codon:yes stop_codon:yes gene_type:complete